MWNSHFFQFLYQRKDSYTVTILLICHDTRVFQLVLQHEPPQTSPEKAFRDSKHVLSGYLEDFGRSGLLLIKMLKGYSLRFTPSYIPSKKRPSLTISQSCPPPPHQNKQRPGSPSPKLLPPKKDALRSSIIYPSTNKLILHHICTSSSLPSSKNEHGWQ